MLRRTRFGVRTLCGALVLALAFAGTGAAVATAWNASGSGDANARATVVAPPPSATSTVDCDLLGTRIDLAWSPSPTSFVDGYTITRSTDPSGPFQTVATIVNRTTAAHRDTGVARNTRYHYRIVATGGLWASTTPATTSITTPTLCL